MKPGFWVAPDGEEAAIVLRPIGAPAPVGGRSATGAPAFLATGAAEALIAACPRVAAMLPEIAAALDAQAADAPGQLFDVTAFSAGESRLLGEVLGEGEVSATVALPGGVVAQVRESVLAGLWRVRFDGPDGAHVGEYLEVAAIPAAVRQATALAAPAIAPAAPPEGAPGEYMNVMPLLAEIADRMARWRKGEPSHVMNFSLLPMTASDMAYLQACLGTGPVALAASGYGTCRVLATGARHVWSVQYSNAGGEVVLDTLEIGDVPTAVLAAEEDFRDSAERLREIAAAYFA
jgi:hydrogenase-1 operon protein HyaF